MNVLVFTALSIGMTLWEGYALMVLWRWFLTPLGLPAVGMAHAIGIALIVNLLTHQASSNAFDYERVEQSIAWSLIAPTVALVVGWLAKGAM